MNTTFIKTYSAICDRLNNSLSLEGNLRTFVHSFIDNNVVVIIADDKNLSADDKNVLFALAIELEDKLSIKRRTTTTSETNKMWIIQNNEIRVVFDFENVR